LKNQIHGDAFLEKGMPCAVEIEKSVLGAVLLDNLVLAELSDLARLDDFYLESHRRIYRAMLKLSQAGQVVDFLTLSDALRLEGEFEQVGGATYLASLIDGVPRTNTLKPYLPILREKSTLRALIRFGAQVQARAIEAEDSSQEIITSAEKALLSLDRQTAKGGLESAGEITGRVISRIEQLFEQHQGSYAANTGVSSGFPDIDALTAGWQAPDLIILAARPSQGKTALALNFAEYAAKSDRVVGFFSLEMSAEQLMSRTLAGQTQLDSHRLRSAYVERHEWDRLSDAWRRISEMKLWVDDSAALKSTQIRARAQRLALEQGQIDLVIVDYLQLVSNPLAARNRQEEVAGVSRDLKALAKDLNCPVIALSQLSRGIEKENRRPHLSDLRESGAIEQDADLVCFLHRDSKTPVVKFILAKQRNGPTGSCYLRFNRQYLQFQMCNVNEAEIEGESNQADLY